MRVPDSGTEILDWRGVLSELGIPYYERGPNCSAGHINIPCPFCQDDPSWHLSIREETGQYYCFRDPRHSGSSPRRLLSRLVGPSELEQILRKHSRWEDLPYRGPSPSFQRQDSAISPWRCFLPARNSTECLEYLHHRGFPNPSLTADALDLRFSPVGEYAGRILFPLTNLSGELISWTGRSIRPGLEPRYKTEPVPSGTPSYFGDLHKPHLILVEGPIDAAKINITGVPGIGAVALTSLRLSETKMRELKSLKVERISLCFDKDVSYSLARSTLDLFRLIGDRSKRVDLLRLPSGYKDPGEMPCQAIKAWLSSIQ